MLTWMLVPQKALYLSKNCPHTTSSVLLCSVATPVSLTTSLGILSVLIHLPLCAYSSVCTNQAALHSATIYKDVTPL